MKGSFWVKGFSTYKTVITAMFAALICVATMLVQIPIPATGGYANLGDGIILMCAFLMQPVYAVLAAGIGSALADILSGYVSFAPGTLIIKAGVALIAALIYRRFSKNGAGRKLFCVILTAGIAAEIFMILGYFAYEAIVMGAGFGAAGGILGNVGQGVVGIIVACAVVPALLRADGIKALFDRANTK